MLTIDGAPVAGIPVTDKQQRQTTFRTSRILYYVGVFFLAELAIRPVGGLTVSDIVFCIALLAALVERAPKNASRRTYLPVTVLYGVLLFLVGATFSSLSSQHVLQSLEATVRVAYITVVWFWLGAAVLRTVHQVLVAMCIWSVSAAICGVAAAVQLFAGNLLLAQSVGGQRFTGLAEHPNDLGGLTAIAVVPASVLVVSREVTPLSRVAGGLVLTAVITGLILSGSVGALLAAVGGTTCWLVLSRVRGRYVVGGLLLVAVVVAALASVDVSGAYSPASRVATVTGHGSAQSATLQSRLDIDWSAVESIARHPLIGVGLDMDSANEQVGVLVHNMLLAVWLGAGLPAVLGLVLVLLSLARLANTARQVAQSARERTIGSALLSAFLAFLLFAMSEPTIYVRYGWVSAALLVALRAVQQRMWAAALESRAR